MIYTFRNAKGGVVERELTRDELMDLPTDPAGKSFIRVDGVKHTRVNCVVGASAPVTMVRAGFNQYPVVSHSLPQWCDGADHVTSGPHAGKPIITSERHKAELCRRHGYTREH